MNLPIENKRNARQLVEMKWFLKRNPTAVYHNYKTLHYFLYEKFIEKVNEVRPMMTWYIGNSAKMSGNYFYSTESHRSNTLTGLMNAEDSKEEYKSERKVKTSLPINVSVGECLVNSWGWEQTQVDFYQVMGKVGKATLIIRPIGYDQRIPTGPMSQEVTPRKDGFLKNDKGEIIEYRVRVTRYSDGENSWSAHVPCGSARRCAWGSKHHNSWYA